MPLVKKFNWQDWVFAIGEVVFLVGLVPTVLQDAKPSIWTSLPTAVMLYAFMAVQISYKNWLTVGLGFITATLWLIIGVQSL